MFVTLRHCSGRAPETFQSLSALLAAKTAPEIVLLTTLVPDARRYRCAFCASFSYLYLSLQAVISRLPEAKDFGLIIKQSLKLLVSAY